VLAADPDPKMRASKFLQFVSKMSKGELMLGDNKVRRGHVLGRQAS
jgi:peroxin-5